MERIGIDTHGYDEPPDPWGGWDDDDDDNEDRLGEIIDEISDLVGEYEELDGKSPPIAGYSRSGRDALTNLRYCPFCRKATKIEAAQDAEGIYMTCTLCNSRGPSRPNTLLAKAAWNAD